MPGLPAPSRADCAAARNLYERGSQTPVKSINFITSHDGFTLNDLVCYAVKGPAGGMR